MLKRIKSTWPISKVLIKSTKNYLQTNKLPVSYSLIRHRKRGKSKNVPTLFLKSSCKISIERNTMLLSECTSSDRQELPKRLKIGILLTDLNSKNSTKLTLTLFAS